MCGVSKCSVLTSLSGDPSHPVYHDFCGKMHFEFQELTLKWNLEYILFVGLALFVNLYRSRCLKHFLLQGT